MSTIKQVAQRYIDDGWAVVPLVNGKKSASGSWAKTEYKACDFNVDDGIAGKCGEPSRWRVDIDLDSVEAVDAAKHLLPNTSLIHGRPNKPDSHYWFFCEGIKTAKFTDVKDTTGRTAMLVEIRSTGGYTMLPPSTHPSGDVLAWVVERDPMTIAPDDLYDAVRDVAIAALLARHWPGHGARHEMVGHLAGFLLQGRLDGAQVVRIIKAAATIAKDTDIQDRLDFANSTVAAFASNTPVTGGPKLAESLGEDVVARLRTWLKGVGEDDLVLDPADPMRGARLFIERDHTIDGVMALRHQAGVFYRYERAYQEREEARLRAELYRFLEPAKCLTKQGPRPFMPTKGKVDNILDALRGLTNLGASQASPCWLHATDIGARDLLACTNGLLHLPTRTLYPLTPYFFTLNALDFDYDPNMSPPEAWLEFLASVWPTDQDSIDTLQEIFGYVLTVDTSFQKVFLLIGPKRSGKGTIARILRLLVGVRNVCNPTLAAFGRDFGKQVLVGKTLAVISDARISSRTDGASVAETLLSISGEDSQTIPRKYLPDWNGQLLVRFLLLTNELPRIGDMSGALASRFIVLLMQQSFFGREDRALYAKLAPEVSGILNWALDGRDRLFKRGHFVQPDSATDTAQQLDDLGSPVKAFIRECCDVLAGTEMKKKDLFEAWKNWCLANNLLNAGTTQTFGRDLRAAIPAVTECQHRPERDWYWKGIRLRHDLPHGTEALPL